MADPAALNPGKAATLSAIPEYPLTSFISSHLLLFAGGKSRTHQVGRGSRDPTRSEQARAVWYRHPKCFMLEQMPCEKYRGWTPNQLGPTMWHGELSQVKITCTRRNLSNVLNSWGGYIGEILKKRVFFPLVSIAIATFCAYERFFHIKSPFSHFRVKNFGSLQSQTVSWWWKDWRVYSRRCSWHFFPGKMMNKRTKPPFEFTCLHIFLVSLSGTDTFRM